VPGQIPVDEARCSAVGDTVMSSPTVDTRSNITSELKDRRSDDVGRVAPGECSMPRA
jgi:hypothetical protein